MPAISASFPLRMQDRPGREQLLASAGEHARPVRLPHDVGHGRADIGDRQAHRIGVRFHLRHERLDRGVVDPDARLPQHCGSFPPDLAAAPGRTSLLQSCEHFDGPELGSLHVGGEQATNPDRGRHNRAAHLVRGDAEHSGRSHQPVLALISPASLLARGAFHEHHLTSQARCRGPIRGVPRGVGEVPDEVGQGGVDLGGPRRKRLDQIIGDSPQLVESTVAAAPRGDGPRPPTRR